VLKHDVLLGVEEVLGVEPGDGVRLRQRVDVGPLGDGGAAGGGFPFLTQGFTELEARNLLEEGIRFLGGLPGVLDLQDVFLEVVFEDIDTASVGLRNSLSGPCGKFETRTGSLEPRLTKGGGVAVDGC
jgi:hypothetical protein